MVDLLNLQPTQISKNLKGKYILLYGEPKVGKTTFLAQIPKALILSFEPGTNALQNAYAQPIGCWSDFKTVLKQLQMPKVKEKFDIIGIDTADMAYEMCIKHICNENDVNQLGEIPYGAGYDLVSKEYSNAFSSLAFLGYGIVFISHSTEKKLEDEKGQEYSQIRPALPPRAYNIINKMVDIIGYIRNIIDKETKQQTRKIFLREDTRFWAGSRFKYIEPMTEFDYDSVTKAIYDAIDKTIAVNKEETGIEQEATEELNPYFKPTYSATMEEAKQLWIKITAKNDEAPIQILDKVDEIMGTSNHAVKISEISEQDLDKLLLIVDFMKNM